MDKKKPYDFPELFREFVLMPKFEENIESLASLAEPEDWDYKSTASPHSKPILRNYVTYTYKRVAEEKKIAVTSDEEYACWNTGLITTKQEPIRAKALSFANTKIIVLHQNYHTARTMPFANLS